MNVRFLGNIGIHQMAVTIPRSGLVCLHAPLPDADLTAGFELLTEKGTVFGRYTDYTTIYRWLDDGGVILSNDGSVWVEPEPVPEPAPYVPTMEEVKAAKKREIGIACEQVIYAGIDVALPSGTEHFSLTEKDQLNLFGKQAQLAAGAAQLEYHQDGHPCRYYTAEEIQLIITAAMEHVSYHTTYCNSLNMWISGAKSVEEVHTIYYGSDVPEEYQSEVLKDYLTAIMAEAEATASETVS